MIGRTLDAMLSPFQIIGRECRDEEGNYPLLYLVDALRRIVLPVERKRYWVQKDESGEEEATLSNDDWSIFFPDDWILKRECAEAFEKRGRVNVGETYQIKSEYNTWFGNSKKNTEVKKISKTAVLFRGHLISSDAQELLEHCPKYFRGMDSKPIPVLYKWVIY